MSLRRPCNAQKNAPPQLFRDMIPNSGAALLFEIFCEDNSGFSLKPYVSALQQELRKRCNVVP